MRKAASIVACGFLLTGGVFVAAQWQQLRVERCETRAARMQEFTFLNSWPDTLQPTQSSAGCDEDNVYAHAGRQFNGVVEHQGVAEFYRLAAAQDGWRVTDRAVPAGGSGTILCARTDSGGIKAYLDLSITTPGSYDLQIGDDLSPECLDVRA